MEQKTIEQQIEAVEQKVTKAATDGMAAKAKEVFEAEKAALVQEITELKSKLEADGQKSAQDKE